MLAQSYTKYLKTYDKDLYARRSNSGVLCVYRRAKYLEYVCDFMDSKLFNVKTRDQFVLSLTDNWAMNGAPRMWGIDRVLNRIREMDVQADAEFFDKIDKANEQVDEAKARHFRNEAEAFFSDHRREFVDAIDEGVGCIHSLSKDEPRKRKKDRSIKNGIN